MATIRKASRPSRRVMTKACSMAVLSEMRLSRRKSLIRPDRSDQAGLKIRGSGSDPRSLPGSGRPHRPEENRPIADLDLLLRLPGAQVERVRDDARPRLQFLHQLWREPRVHGGRQIDSDDRRGTDVRGEEVFLPERHLVGDVLGARPRGRFAHALRVDVDADAARAVHFGGRNQDAAVTRAEVVHDIGRGDPGEPQHGVQHGGRRRYEDDIGLAVRRLLRRVGRGGREGQQKSGDEGAKGHAHPPILDVTAPRLRYAQAMAVIVQKYGGSSVADVDKLRRVAERVMRTRAQGHSVVVVVSAMGDTTDELLAMAKKVSPNPQRRELDMLLSAGERISMALLSLAIHELGGDAISFTGSQSGIITNDRHVDARIIEVRPFRVQDELARGKIVVVAGYQGVSYRKEVTTLGRGGSDTTAVAMAAALDAEYCEICSDVDGVYSADPRVVPAARRIAVMSYEETQEMAEAGAKVLNAQAVEFAKDKGIAIYARATTGPLPGTHPSVDGTVVRKPPPRMPGTVIGVASERDLLVLEWVEQPRAGQTRAGLQD